MSLITHNGIQYEIFDELSNHDCTGWYLADRYTAEELSGKVIYNSCFSNENMDAEIFPGGVTGLTLIASNFDNILIPEGTTVIDCLTRRFEVQNDGEDWFMEEDP